MKNPAPSQIKNPPHFAPAFSLVEVLTVIAIISVLMTAGAIGLGNLTAGKGTSSAIATCESLFEEARTIAVSKRCKARVMIFSDVQQKDSPNYLRRVVISHEKIKDDGTVDTGKWQLAGRGYTMPSGTFFSKEFSKTESGAKIKTETLGVTDGASATYRGSYSTYEFNSEGIISEPGAKFIIGSGILTKNAENPRTVSGAERDFAGFVIWRNGRTSSFRSPDQMGISGSDTKF